MSGILHGQRKSLPAGSLKLDTAGAGTFRATFSRFNVIDADRDVTLPGAFAPGQKVRLSQWGHNWGLPTIGTGVIDADDAKAWVDGRFNLNMQAGRDTYESVKANSEAGLQEWSYGYDITDWSPGKWGSQEVRFLKGLDVIEVSPVMLGAGIGTRTEVIKGAPRRRPAIVYQADALLIELEALPKPKRRPTVVLQAEALLIELDALGILTRMGRAGW